MRDGSLARYCTKLRHPQVILALLHGRDLKSRGVKVRKGFCINCVEVRNDWVVEGIEEWATMKLMMSYFEKGRCQKNCTIFTSGGMMGSIFSC